MMFILISIWVLSGCSALGSDRVSEAQIASATTDLDGLARVTMEGGVVDFQVLSGMSGERITGIQLRVATFGGSRLLYAEDPTGLSLPVAAPLNGSQAVRRLVMAPRVGSGYNITTAEGTLSTTDLEFLGALNEEDLQSKLKRSGDSAVLLYEYNPSQPLALTGASLDTYATPFDNVFYLRPGAEPIPASASFVIVSLNKNAFDGWSHIAVDRYLASRIGMRAQTDLRADLTFAWAYPVFDVFPGDDELDLGAGTTVTLRINWRSQNPDPPPPWSFFVSSEDENVTIEPDNFALSPGDPPQEVTVTIDRTLLAEGEHEVVIFIQPFSDTFGLIEQGIERTITLTVAEAVPTPTPGPSIDLFIDPAEPREGGTLTVTAEGFNPNETVLLEFIGAERTISDGLATADGGGAFAYDIDLRNTPEGEYTLRLTGAESGITGTLTVYVDEKPPDAIVLSDELNVRTGPTYDHPVIDIVVKGDELQVVGTNNDDTWIEVITPTGERGWVVRDLVELFIDLADVPWNPNYPSP